MLGQGARRLRAAASQLDSALQQHAAGAGRCQGPFADCVPGVSGLWQHQACGLHTWHRHLRQLPAAGVVRSSWCGPGGQQANPWQRPERRQQQWRQPWERLPQAGSGRHFTTSPPAALRASPPAAAAGDLQQQHEQKERRREAAEEATEARTRAAMDAHLARMDYKMGNVGYLIQPYKGPPAKLGADWALSKEGRRRAWERVQNALSLGMCLALLWRSVPGFSYASIKTAGAELYYSVNRALASGQLDSVKDMVVPGEYRILFQTQERWRKQRWDRVVWSLEEEIRLKDIKIAHGRLMKMHKDSKVGFIQITLKIPSRQRFTAYTNKGSAPARHGGAPKAKLVAGDPDAVIDAVDYWVIERKIFDGQAIKQKIDPPGARWRLAGRVELEDGAAGGGGGGGGAGA